MEQFIDEYSCEGLKRGQVVDGEIIRVENEAIFVDVGSKRDAYVPRKDIDKLDDEFVANISSGDLIPVEIDRVPIGNGDLIASISKGLKRKDWEYAHECLETGEIHNLKVVDWNRGGLLVEFGELRGFVPNSHINDLLCCTSRAEINERKAQKIGTYLSLIVIEVDRERDRLILSEKAIGQDLRRRKLKELNVGQITFCRVLNIVDFGLFVDLGGVTGLIHVSELAWERVENPDEKFSFGDEVLAKIINIDVEHEQVKLSCKALIPNPWNTIGEQHQVGDWVEGHVTGIMDYGAFVKLPSGLEGLIHISEMSNGSEISPYEFFRLDQKVRVRIVYIDPARERISLSLLDVASDDMNSANLR